MLRTPARSRSFAALGLAFACGGPPAHDVDPARPLDERRAIEVIVDAFQKDRTQPAPGGDISLAGGARLRVEVIAAGKRYGVAYVTAREQAELGTTLTEPPGGMGDALQVIAGIGADRDAMTLILRDRNYLYEDNVGDSHDQTAVSAELKLRRDVSDFLVRARAEHWK